MRSRRYRLNQAFSNPTKLLRKRLSQLRRVSVKEPNRVFNLHNSNYSITVREGQISIEYFKLQSWENEANDILSHDWTPERSQRLRDILG